jgi:hypothetical protein
MGRLKKSRSHFGPGLFILFIGETARQLELAFWHLAQRGLRFPNPSGISEGNLKYLKII